MAAPDNVLRLRDGRLLGYAEYGDPQGRPLFYFHGYPNSRLGAQIAHEAAARGGVRIVALDRPGFGLSDFQPGRRIVDWPNDVVEAADALGVERFAVIGISGGGPYAAACAAKVPPRLTAVAIVSGLGPLDVPASVAGMGRLQQRLLPIARRIPGLHWLVRPGLAVFGRLVRRFPEQMLSLMSRTVPPADKAVLARRDVRAVMRADLAEAFRQGSRGAAWELSLFLRPWGFRLEEISIAVDLWQGGVDVNVPASMGRYQAQTIPTCRARFYPDEGHLLVIDRLEEIQEALFAGAPQVTR